MTKEQLIDLFANKLKLIRTEHNLTQEKMAELLGISKKTLVQIEKERIKPGWTLVIAACALFRESSIIQNELGSDPLDVIKLVALEESFGPKNKTLGGHVWWKVINKSNGFILQQNVLSKHYRIIDKENFRWFSTFDHKEAETTLRELSDNKK